MKRIIDPSSCRHLSQTVCEGSFPECADCGMVNPPPPPELCQHNRLKGPIDGSKPMTCIDCGWTIQRVQIDGYVDQVEGVTVHSEPDMVNHPPHYRSSATCSECGHPIQCIDVIRHIRDGRIYTAMKYLWRIGLGGGKGNDKEDAGKARWYVTDYIDHDISN